MVVTFLDLKTGRTAQEKGIDIFQLCVNNWNCDCNRMIPFEGLDSSDTCLGHKRFIAIDVQAEPKDAPFDKRQVLVDANEHYYLALLN